MKIMWSPRDPGHTLIIPAGGSVQFDLPLDSADVNGEATAIVKSKYGSVIDRVPLIRKVVEE